MILVILGVMWGIYLASWLWSRARMRSVDSVEAFGRNLAVLERTLPPEVRRRHLRAVDSARRHRAGSIPGGAFERGSTRRAGLGVMTLQEARRRRRNILVGLSGAVVVSLFPAVAWGGVMVAAHVLCVSLLFAYVGLLARAQKITRERKAKVRYLHSSSPVTGRGTTPRVAAAGTGR